LAIYPGRRSGLRSELRPGRRASLALGYYHAVPPGLQFGSLRSHGYELRQHIYQNAYLEPVLKIPSPPLPSSRSRAFPQGIEDEHEHEDET
jgi:hypothetical protein